MPATELKDLPPQNALRVPWKKRVRDLAFAESILEVTLDPVIVIDQTGIIQLFNTAAARAFKRTANGVVGQGIEVLIPGDHRAAHAGYMRNYLETGETGVIGIGREVEALRSDGSTFWARLAVVETSVAGERYFVGTVHDLTLQKQHEEELHRYIEDLQLARTQSDEQAARMTQMAEELEADRERLANQEQQLRINEEELKRYIIDIEESRNQYEAQAADLAGLAEEVSIEKEKVEESRRLIEYQACHDALTDLGNRMLLNQALPRMLEDAGQRDGSVGLIYIDLDNFKPVNDRLGHEAGDDLLRQVAAALKETITDADEAIRLGGDEFALIIGLEPGHGEAELRAMAERTLKALSIPVEGPDFTIQTGASLGIALYPRDGDDMDSILKAADEAMYEAKRAGKGQVR